MNMKRGSILVGFLLLGFSVHAVPRGDAPPKPNVRVTTSTSGPQQAKPPTKPAWQFTDDERIALRTNSGLARQRVAERRQRRTTAGIHAASVSQQLADSLDGAHRV